MHIFYIDNSEQDQIISRFGPDNKYEVVRAIYDLRVFPGTPHKSL